MGNCLIGYPNLIDDATLSLGTWNPTLPQSNLQDRRLGYVARTANDTLGATRIKMVFSNAQTARILALVNHNLSQDAQYRVIAGPIDTETYNSGWLDVWGDTYSTTTLGAYVHTLTHIIPAGNTHLDWNLHIDDTENDSGYVQAGRIFLGNAFSPTINMLFGASLAPETHTEVNQALSGAEYFQRRKSHRVARFEISGMTHDEGMDLFDVLMSAGTDKEVFFVYDPEDEEHMLRRAFLGRFRTLSQMEHPQWNYHSVGCEIKELLP